jgi:RNA polymerase sigma-70 factor (ECF subfamily)
MTDCDHSQHDAFLRLFTAHETAVRAFVRSLVPTLNDANDVMQEVAIVLWRRFDDYDVGQDFRGWAFGVAKMKILSWQRDRARDKHVFGVEVTDLLANHTGHDADRLEAQREALRLCLGKLPAEQRRLVDEAYAPGIRINELARALGQSLASVYKRLHRIRLALVECTRGQLARKDGV